MIQSALRTAALAALLALPAAAQMTMSTSTISAAQLQASYAFLRTTEEDTPEWSKSWGNDDLGADARVDYEASSNTDDLNARVFLDAYAEGHFDGRDIEILDLTFESTQDLSQGEYDLYVQWLGDVLEDDHDVVTGTSRTYARSPSSSKEYTLSLLCSAAYVHVTVEIDFSLDLDTTLDIDYFDQSASMDGTASLSVFGDVDGYAITVLTLVGAWVDIDGDLEIVDVDASIDVEADLQDGVTGSATVIRRATDLELDVTLMELWWEIKTWEVVDQHTSSSTWTYTF